MNRILTTTITLLFLSTSLGLANDLVPGSDTTIRDAQSQSDRAVAVGGFGVAASREASAYGYPTQAQSPVGIVPGSDTTIRDRHNAYDAAVARGIFGDRADGTYGYPTVRGAAASDRADDRAIDRTAGVPIKTMRGALVPGSDSF